MESTHTTETALSTICAQNDNRMEHLVQLIEATSSQSQPAGLAKFDLLRQKAIIPLQYFVTTVLHTLSESKDVIKHNVKSV
jgi:hypothetical protein